MTSHWGSCTNIADALNALSSNVGGLHCQLSDDVKACIRGLWSIRSYGEDGSDVEVAWRRFCLRKVLLSHARDTFKFECTCNDDVKAECQGYVTTLHSYLGRYSNADLFLIHEELKRLFIQTRPCLGNAPVEQSCEASAVVRPVERIPSYHEVPSNEEQRMQCAVWAISQLSEKELMEALVLRKYRNKIGVLFGAPV